MRQIGKGFAGAFKLCSTLNLPRLTKTTYKNQEAKLLKVVQEVAEESMIKAATEIVEKQQNLSSDIVKCGISVDGTWQRRGYTSMNGCVAAISVDTGKVLDIEVMSSYCPICKRLQTMPRNFEYESSKADHICQCNFTGSSSKMQIVGASRIFLRSEKNRRLQYTQYYGDGDSKAFMSVKDTYGLNSVTKFECIGHVQKRVGSRLRKLKTKTKGLSGKGKLTDNFIDRLQNYYGIAVRSNVGNLTAMQQNASRRAVLLARCTVRNCWEQWTPEGTHVRKTGSGATRKTTRREDERIVRQALVDPTVTRSTIRADVGVAIVPQTISRQLAEANLKSKRPFRALPLTPDHRQLCLQWCQARSMWNVTDW
ncbi:uncharacterized protein TNCV_396011 [Trichonephila clavipes]|nr:uncharacterized protein TNCV_396011 [Trichonephila clavipes]